MSVVLVRLFLNHVELSFKNPKLRRLSYKILFTLFAYNSENERIKPEYIVCFSLSSMTSVIYAKFIKIVGEVLFMHNYHEILNVHVIWKLKPYAIICDIKIYIHQI